MLQCLIIDDEEMAIKVIVSHCSQIKNIEIVDTCTSALQALTILQTKPIDLIFLDIQMPQMSGFSLLRTLATPPSVILTTAHREFAMESYDYEVSDYLLKPIAFERFLKAVNKVLEQKKRSKSITTDEQPISYLGENPFIVIKSERQFIKVVLDDILYIESLKNHCQIVTIKGKYMTLIAISDLEEKLPPQRFIRVHRSFIVAFSKIGQFTHTNLTIADQLIPIGEVYKELVWGKLNRNLV
jgi:DNA-binding LytR/AlgR family response regulator